MSFQIEIIENIISNIYENTDKSITGDDVQSVLIDMVVKLCSDMNTINFNKCEIGRAHV